MQSLSLRIKLLLLLTGLTVLPLSLVGSTLLLKDSAEIKRRANADLLQTAGNLARLIDQTCTETWIAPLALARDTLANSAMTGPERANILAGVTGLPDIVAVELLSADGGAQLELAARATKRFNVYASALPSLLGISWNTVAQGVAGNQTFVSDAHYNARYDFWSVVIALPLRGQHVPTVLAARISLDSLRARIVEQPAQSGGHVALVDGRGVRLLDTNGESPSASLFNDIRAALTSGQRREAVRPYNRSSGQMMLAAFAPLHHMNWAIVAERSEASAYAGLRDLFDSLGLLLACSLGLALVGARMVAGRISKPILQIVTATEEIANGQFDVYIPDADHRTDEIGVLGQQINHMAAGLRERERIKDIFGRYQTVEVMQTLLGDPNKLALGGEMRTVTIMMTDLRGFTAAAGRLPPDQVLSMLNNYFEVMVAICSKHNGTIIEILGDALLVLFGAPVATPDHALRGVACAIEMQNAMNSVNETNAKAGLPQLEMGVGLNTGDVVVGNIGSQKRAKYGVVGTHVNLASRIESYTVGGQVLVSRAVRDAAGAAVRVGSERMVEAKGLSTPLAICEVTGVGAPYNMSLSQSEEPMQTLAAPVAMSLCIIEGKDVQKGTLPAKLTRMCSKRAVLEVDRELPTLTNLRMNCIVQTLTTLDVYAKVLGPEGNGGHAYIIHFTSVPKEVQAHFNGLQNARVVAHHKPPPAKPKPVPMTLIGPGKIDR